MKKFLLIVAIVFSCVVFSPAQTMTDDEDFQSWNDFQITARMTKQFDYYFQLTGRFGNNLRQLSDQRIAAGFVWKAAKNLAVTPFFWYVNARNAAGQLRDEQQLVLRANYKFPFKKFGLAHRGQYEYRIRSPQNSWRYRAMLTVDKDLLKSRLPKSKVFVADEVFYDSLIGKFNRHRFMIGVNKILNKNLSLDLYYMRQNDGYSHPGDLNAVWTSWKLHL